MWLLVLLLSLTNVLGYPVWGSFDASRVWQGDPGIVLTDGSLTQPLRTMILDSGMQIGEMTDSLTPTYLDTIDVFWTSIIWKDAVSDERLSQDEQNALVSWVNNSGGVFVAMMEQTETNENSKSFVNPFQIAGDGFLKDELLDPHPVPGTTHILARDVVKLAYGGDPGHGGSSFSVENPNAEVVFVDDTDEPCVAVIENIPPGMGDVFVIADVNPFHIWAGIGNDNEQFMLNLMDWVWMSATTPGTTASPTPGLTASPTPGPTANPTSGPTPVPTSNPTNIPTLNPSVSPSFIPTLSPTFDPTFDPTPGPTASPTASPTSSPTPGPTANPTASPIPGQATVLTPDPTQFPTALDIVPGDIEGSLIQDCFLHNDSLQLTIHQSEVYDDASVCVGDSDGEYADESKCVFENSDHSYSVNSVQTHDVDACFPAENSEDFSFSSPVFTVEENGGDIRHFEFSFQYRFEGDLPICGKKTVESLDCHWYDEETKEWTSDGCETAYSVFNETTHTITIHCKCTHLTAFIILQEIQEKDHCNLFFVIGNPLFLAFAFLYGALLLVSVYQIGKMIQIPEYRRSAQLNAHVLIACLACIQMCIDVSIFVNFVNLIALSILWALLHTMSLWSYVIVVLSLARVYHTANLRETYSRKLPYIFYGTCIFVSLTIFVVFVLVAAAGKREALAVGSLIVGVVCIFDAVVFCWYGSHVLRTLMASRTSMSGSKSTSFAALIHRMFKVTVGMTISFIGENVIFIISGYDQLFFLENFTVLETLYLAFDFLTLSIIVYLFFEVVCARSLSTVSNMRSSIHQSVELQQV